MDSYTGPLIVPAGLRGYRCWRLANREEGKRFPRRAEDARLFPVHADTSPPWEPRRMTASCDKELAGRHERRKHADVRSPVKDCACGFYATYEPRAYRDHLPQIWDMYEGKDHAFVHGSIIATGRVILGSRGFRAEYAQIEALWGLLTAGVARFYGVPWFRTHRAFVKHYPRHDVSALLDLEE